MPLLELYTSEGCNSCPPADRWASSLLKQKLAPVRVVVLGFHVDYWDDLGWPDRFARREYTARQQMSNRRNGARFVYTPQFLLNGRDYRHRPSGNRFAETIAAVAKQPSAAWLSVTANVREGTFDVQGTYGVTRAADARDARGYVALYENGLSSKVKAGENRGRRLLHDFVVRELAGPFPADARGRAALSHRFVIRSRWNPALLHVAAFVQNERTGDVLQALVLADCTAPGA